MCVSIYTTYCHSKYYYSLAQQSLNYAFILLTTIINLNAKIGKNLKTQNKL